MSTDALELITMADIARLAGQTRATAGNWKARNPDFPPERGRSSRGPLYDRAEVVRWLEATNRLAKGSKEAAAIWQATDQLRGSLTADQTLALLLLLLALMSELSPEEWHGINEVPPRHLGAKLRDYVLDVFPFAEVLIPSQEIPSQALQQVLDGLGNLDRAQLPAVASAVLEQAAKAIGRSGGEHLTPPSVRKLLIALLRPQGVLYNPASGTGQLLIDAATAAAPRTVSLFGQEISTAIWAMSQLNLAIHNVEAKVAVGDVFSADHYPDLRADRVVAVPPFNMSLRNLDHFAEDPRWVWAEPGPNDGNVAWIQHCLYHLADGGRAAIVVANGVLSARGREGRTRKRIIEAGLLDAVVALPPGLFPSTGIPCAVLVLAKGRSSVGMPPTLMVDTRSAKLERAGHAVSLPDDVISEVVRIYRRWVTGEMPDSEMAAIARFEDLVANDFGLNPARYVSVARSSWNAGEAAAERAELIGQLHALSQASRDADDRLRTILKGPR